MQMQRKYCRDFFLISSMCFRIRPMPLPVPRLSFGPGQRYASEDCYIVQLSSGEKPEIITKSNRVIH
jgi:hypothetical protein